MHKKKIFRVATVSMSLDILLKGQLKFLQQYYDITAISGADEHLDEVERREGVRVKNIKMKREISVFNDVVSLFRLYWFFRKEKPALVHSITPKAGLLTMIAGKMAGVPVRMHTFTGLVFPAKSGFKKRLLIWMDKLLCACATHIYPEGKGVKKELLQYRITSKPLSIIANGNINGVDLTYFDPYLFSDEDKIEQRQKLGIEKQDFVFVFLGRLVRDKGVAELVEAFTKLNATGRIKLLLVGDYEQNLDPLPAKIVSDIEMYPDIISVGFVKDVRPYLSISDVLVLASYKEGFPNSVLQAAAMGLPCIVTDISGNNEIITHGDTGWIIPVRNTEALQEAMKKALVEYKRNAQFSQYTRRKIALLYEQSVVWNALLFEYQKHLR